MMQDNNGNSKGNNGNSNGNRHNPESLEAQANEILKKAKAMATGEYPCYSEEYLIKREHRRGERSIEEIYEDTLAAIQPVDDLLYCAWQEVRSGAHKAGLSIKSIEMLEYRRVGCTTREISELVGVPETSVRRDLCKSAVRVQSIPAFGLWTVLAEIFCMDVSTIKYLLKK